MKKENLQDRYLDELLREESQGQKSDEAMIGAIEKAIDETQEEEREVAAIRAEPPTKWAWVALFVGAGICGISYLSMKEEVSPEIVLTADEQKRASIEKAEEELTKIEEQLLEQEALVEEKRKALDTIVQAIGVPYAEGVEQSIVLLGEKQLYESEREKEQLVIQLKKLLSLENDELMKYAAGLELPNNGVPEVYTQYQEATSQLTELQASGLGAGHPEIKMQKFRVEKLSKDLGKSVVYLRDILQTQLDLVESRLASMNEVVYSRSDRTVNMAMESHDYIEAKRDYENAEREKQNLKLAQISKKVSLKMKRGDYIAEEPEVSTALKDINYNLFTEKSVYAQEEETLAQLAESHAVSESKGEALDRTVPPAPTTPPGLLAYEPGKNPATQPSSKLALYKVPHSVESDALAAGVAVNERVIGRRAIGQNLAALDVADVAYFGNVKQRRPHLHPSTAPPEGGSEKYGALADQAWLSPRTEPLSTFSVDVDTASYTNIRRILNAGQKVPADAVRVEECINYFDYNYAGPQDGKPFATHVNLATCPWDEEHLLLKVGLKGKEVPMDDRPASNLVFLLDVSGSMQNSDKLPLVVESMKILVEELDGRDRVSIVVYAGAEGVVLEPTKITEDGRGDLLAALNKLRAGGSTNGGAGIKRAYQIAQDQFVKDGVNRVILCTDGDFNVGATGQEELVALVKNRAQEGVFLSVLGFGTGNINDSMLEAITNDGNGNYFYIDNIWEGRKVFLQDLSGTLVTIAKDVKIQLEFNPQKVANYRLIGYANRRLKKEDFNNDKVDAGDIGAGHTVTALYEIVPVGSESPIREEVDPLKYQAKEKAPEKVVPVEVSKEWLNVKLRYKQPDEDVSTKIEMPVEGAPENWKEAGADFQLAAGVALFGMKLRDSQYVGNADWSLVKMLAQKGQGDDVHGHRGEFLKLVGKAGK